MMDLRRLSKYFSHVRKYRVTLFWIFVFSLVLTASSLFHTMLLSVVIDEILVVKDLSALGVIILLIIAIYVLQLLVKYIVGYLGMCVTQAVSVSLRMRVFDSILHKRMSLIQKENNSEMVSTVLVDAQLLSNFLCTRPIQTINALLTIVITFALIFTINKKMSLLAVASIVIQLVISFYLASIAKHNQQEIRTKDAEHLSILKQLMGSIKYIKAYKTEKYNKNQYFGFLRKIFLLGERTFNISYIYNTTTSVLSFAGSMLIFTVGVIEIIRGNLTVGVLFVYDSLVDTLYSGISNISSLLYDLNKISVSCERMDRLFEMEREESGQKMLDTCISDIQYRDVCFRYGDKKILDNVCLDFEAGKTYAIIGKSGVGKSTLISLLAGFHDCNSGKICVDGTDINDINLKELRRRITFVFQEGIIIDGSVKDNICFGIDCYSEEKLEKILRICHVDEMCEKLDEGIQTQIRQDENNISGGQKQRIFLARALLRESDVYVFDESFSQVDKQLEKQIINSIIEEYDDKLLIFITHNVLLMKEIPEMNLIIIEDGEGIVCGTHGELMEKSDTYQQLIMRDGINEEWK